MQRPTANAPDRVRSQDGPPARVRLSRTRGWRLPPNTIKVDRTTRWGNPYDVREYGTELALHLFASTARGSWSNANVRAVDLPTVETLHAAHATWLRRIGEDLCSAYAVNCAVETSRAGVLCPITARTIYATPRSCCASPTGVDAVRRVPCTSIGGA